MLEIDNPLMLHCMWHLGILIFGFEYNFFYTDYSTVICKSSSSGEPQVGLQHSIFIHNQKIDHETPVWYNKTRWLALSSHRHGGDWLASPVPVGRVCVLCCGCDLHERLVRRQHMFARHLLRRRLPQNPLVWQSLGVQADPRVGMCACSHLGCALCDRVSQSPQAQHQVCCTHILSFE